MYSLHLQRHREAAVARREAVLRVLRGPDDATPEDTDRRYQRLWGRTRCVSALHEPGPAFAACGAGGERVCVHWGQRHGTARAPTPHVCWQVGL